MKYSEPMKIKEHATHVVKLISTGDLVVGYDSEEEARGDAAWRNAKASHLGVKALYVMIEV